MEECKRRYGIDLSAQEKLKVIAFRKGNTESATLAQFPSVSRSTLKRMMKEQNALAKLASKGLGCKKRKQPMKKYKEMGQAVDLFFRSIREAHGAVTRSLLEAFILTLSPDIKKRVLSNKGKVS